MKDKSCLSKAALSLAALLITLNSLPAQTTKVWSGGAANNYWRSGFNWADTAAPEPGTETELVFTGGTRPEPQNDYDVDSQFMSLIQDAGATTGFTLRGNAIYLARGITNQSGFPLNVALNSISAPSGLELSSVDGDIVISNNFEISLGERGSMLLRVAPDRTVWFKTAINVGGYAGDTGGELRLVNGGRVILTKANTYRDTIVTAGTVQVGDGVTTGTLGNGVVNLTSVSSRLAFKPSGTVVVNNAVTGTGSVSVEGPGTVVLQRSQPYLVATTVGGGTLVLDKDSNFGTAQTTVNAAALLQIGPSFPKALAWPLTLGGGALDLAGMSIRLTAFNGSGTIQNSSREGAEAPSYLTVENGSFNGTIEPAATGQRTILEKAPLGTFIFSGTANCDVEVGGALGMSGDVVGLVNNRSKLSVGTTNAVSSLRLSTGPTMSENSQLIMNVNSERQCDKLTVTSGPFVCSGGKLVIIALGPLVGGTYDLIDSSFEGRFSAIELPTTGAGQEWIDSEFYSEGKLILNTKPLTISLSKSRAKGLSLKIPVSEFCTDPDIGDTLSFDSITNAYPGQCTVAISDGMLFYTPEPGFDTNDTLEYTVTDSHGSQSTGTIQIQVVEPTTRIENIEQVGDDLVLRLNGIPGFRYAIEQSSTIDFVPYAVAHVFLTPTNGAYRWSTPKPTTGSAYFRMRWLP